MVIGQIELSNSKKFITNDQREIEEVLTDYGSKYWFLTAPSISEGINHIYTKNDEVKNLLKKIIKAKFDGDVGTTKKLWLRKEILIKLSELEK